MGNLVLCNATIKRKMDGASGIQCCIVNCSGSEEERTVTRLAQPVYALPRGETPLKWLDEVPVAAGQRANA
jgi:hypothetical protein